MADSKSASQKDAVVALHKGENNRSAPHSQDAERALLGALLLNNKLYADIDGDLLPEHFYVGAHGKVFGAISRLLDRDQVAHPVSLTNYFG